MDANSCCAKMLRSPLLIRAWKVGWSNTPRYRWTHRCSFCTSCVYLLLEHPTNFVVYSRLVLIRLDDKLFEKQKQWLIEATIGWEIVLLLDIEFRHVLYWNTKFRWELEHSMKNLPSMPMIVTMPLYMARTITQRIVNKVIHRLLCMLSLKDL